MDAKPNYLNILLHIKEKKVVPFFGAGASLGPPPPESGSADAPAPPTNPAGVYAPSSKRLARILAKEFKLTDPDLTAEELDDLAKVTSYGDVTNARLALRFVLREELGKDFTLGPIHLVAADLAGYLPLIVTTNYDLLLEKAMGTRPYHLVVHGVASDKPPGDGILWWRPGMPRTEVPERMPAGRLKLDPEKEEYPIIYKLHGSVLPGKDCFVISEADYVDFLHRMAGRNGVPGFFANYMRSRSLLFLGYSLADWNVRVLLRSVFFSTQRRAGTPHWAVNWGVKALEKRLWLGRGIDVFNLTADEFAAGLSAEMARVAKPA